jgi:hypothetical protein
MMRTRGRHRTLLLAFVVGLVLALGGCGSSSENSTGTAASGPTRTGHAAVAATTAGATTTTPAKASRATPLAERTFRVDPKPTDRMQRAAVEALEGYFDGLIRAFATNKVAGSGVRRYTTPAMYADAQRLIREQVEAPKGGYVLYGAYAITIRLQGVSSRAAVLDVCVDQSRTRRHNPTTDAPGRWNNTPYVRVTYNLNRLAIGWVVVDYSGRTVASCRA